MWPLMIQIIRMCSQMQFGNEPESLYIKFITPGFEIIVPSNVIYEWDIEERMQSTAGCRLKRHYEMLV